MVEYRLDLNSIFASLADPTRRDIISRLATGDLTVGELARPYATTFAAISKHLMVLENARLVTKERRGKERVVTLSPYALANAEAYLRQYERYWQDRFDALSNVLEEQQRISKQGQ